MTKSAVPHSSLPPAEGEAAAPSFEQALAELEKLVAAMETPVMTLDQSVKAYQRGAELVRLCQKHLEDARVRLQVVEDGELRPLDLDR
ncbi:hypothetical protein BH10PSE17_BH10PSE17_12110 [soil metagenome]